MLIETETRLKVVAETADANEAPQFITSQRPDLILVDLPDVGGRELFQMLEQSAESVPVLILAGSHEVEIYQKCLKLGIAGLVSKDKSADLLRKAIQKVHDGELWFDRTIMGKTIRLMLNEKQAYADGQQSNSESSLTDRERQVVELICRGLKNKAIAEELFITETTVRHHLTSIFNKLSVSTRLELVIFAFKHNLVKTPKVNEPFSERTGRANGYRYA
jgi:DNA-binding NarL/FixJ family response regulator